MCLRGQESEYDTSEMELHIGKMTSGRHFITHMKKQKRLSLWDSLWFLFGLLFFYFPIQKLANMFPNNSSLVT